MFILNKIFKHFLVHDKNTPLRVVRKFVHLLEHNNTDLNEEIGNY
jgi:hypothetical protein